MKPRRAAAAVIFGAACLSVFPCLAAVDDGLGKLIDKLTEVSEPGFGYAGYFSGSEFLPYGDSEEMGMLVLGAAYHSPSETLRQIVAKGAAAVPTLLQHLSDDRKIKMQPMSGMMWIRFSDEYDYNRQTRPKPPEGVNRDSFKESAEHPSSHAITVGDLCFVALGQIVNRNFAATRYQPTGGLIVSSPTYSKRLCEVLRADWDGFTRAKHQRLLIEDFEHPDYEDRRIGAYLRLSFYYPGVVESIVLQELHKPTWDSMRVYEFCRQQLYKASEPKQRKELYDQFVREHGPQYAVGVMDQLYGDLNMLEAQEEHRVNPPLTAYGSQPRELLIQLFDKPANVKSADRPHVAISTVSGRARLIGALTHDQSQKIGDIVKQLFLDNPNDEYLASACLRCLAARGYEMLLVEQLGKIDFSKTKASKLHLKYLESISISKQKPIQDKLLLVLQTTANDEYFMVALKGLDKTDDSMVLTNAARILAGLPEDTDRGLALLGMIARRFPAAATDLFKTFLAKGDARRAETMCRVLWYGNPLSKVILAPLLDDQRELSGFSIPMRLCDRAAQAISNTEGAPKFDSEWPLPQKDAAIRELKSYCTESAKPQGRK